MKVAMVSEHADPMAALGSADAGGQNVHVASLASELGRRGVEVVVHTRRDAAGGPRRRRLAPGATVDLVDAGPARPVQKDLLLPYMDRFADELRRQWLVDRPDLVHAHFWMSGRAALAAAAPLGIPVVQTFHALGNVKRRYQGDADTSPPERLGTEQHLVGAVDHIVATCSDEAFELCALGADPGRLTIVPCGVDLALFSPAGPRLRRSRAARLVVVGRLVERKGVADVLAALAHVPGAELWIAGGPGRHELGADPEARRLAGWAHRLGVAGRVTFAGALSRPEVAALLRSADVTVAVPWYEPFGIVPLEAMACGVPVVASAVGGLLDSVADGVTGVHVPPRDPDALAAVLRRLVPDGGRRARMGEAAQRRARARYGWPRVAGATYRVYRRVIERCADRHPVPSW